MNFPKHISQLDHLLDHKIIRFKNEEVNHETVTLVSYMVKTNDLYKLTFGDECRGLVYDSNGVCICAPFHSFRNVGECEETLPENLPTYYAEITILEKRDGSMLTPVIVGDLLCWKTKKSFVSDVAVSATITAAKTPKLASFCYMMIAFGFTPIFEYTDPKHEIVVDYGKEPKFVLLAARSMLTGQYMTHRAVQLFAEKYDIEIISSYDLTKDQIDWTVKNSEDFEGYVIRYDIDSRRSFMVKQKTDWYLRMHRVKTALRERDVFDMYLDETLDDTCSSITAAGLSLDPINKITNLIDSILNDMIMEVESCARWAKVMKDRKEVAGKFQGNPYFGLIMKAYSNAEPNYKQQLIKQFRDTFSLDTIYSNFKVEECE